MAACCLAVYLREVWRLTSIHHFNARPGPFLQAAWRTVLDLDSWGDGVRDGARLAAMAGLQVALVTMPLIGDAWIGGGHPLLASLAGPGLLFLFKGGRLHYYPHVPEGGLTPRYVVDVKWPVRIRRGFQEPPGGKRKAHWLYDSLVLCSVVRQRKSRQLELLRLEFDRLSGGSDSAVLRFFNSPEVFEAIEGSGGRSFYDVDQGHTYDLMVMLLHYVRYDLRLLEHLVEENLRKEDYAAKQREQAKRRHPLRMRVHHTVLVGVSSDGECDSEAARFSHRVLDESVHGMLLECRGDLPAVRSCVRVRRDQRFVTAEIARVAAGAGGPPTFAVDFVGLPPQNLFRFGTDRFWAGGGGAPAR